MPYYRWCKQCFYEGFSVDSALMCGAAQMPQDKKNKIICTIDSK